MRIINLFLLRNNGRALDLPGSCLEKAMNEVYDGESVSRRRLLFLLTRIVNNAKQSHDQKARGKQLNHTCLNLE